MTLIQDISALCMMTFSQLNDTITATDDIIRILQTPGIGDCELVLEHAVAINMAARFIMEQREAAFLHLVPLPELLKKARIIFHVDENGQVFIDRQAA